MSYSCKAFGCTNSWYNSKLHFFRFPRDKHRCKIWVERAGNSDLFDIQPEDLYDDARLCSLHFSPAEYTNSLCIRLNWNAVPSIFHHHQDQVAVNDDNKALSVPSEMDSDSSARAKNACAGVSVKADAEQGGDCERARMHTAMVEDRDMSVDIKLEPLDIAFGDDNLEPAAEIKVEPGIGSPDLAAREVVFVDIGALESAVVVKLEGGGGGEVVERPGSDSEDPLWNGREVSEPEAFAEPRSPSATAGDGCACLQRHPGSCAKVAVETDGPSEDVWKESSVVGEKTEFKCGVCGASFDRRAGLTRHERMHPLERPFPCRLCPKTFSRRGYLTAHVRRHTADRQHACDSCDRTFLYPSLLDNHRRTHGGVRPFACHVCGKTFAQRSYLRTHVQNHTGRKRFACHVCDKSFAWSCNLATHVRVHSREKPYKCVHCDRAFTQFSHHAQHVLTHSMSKPFLCPVCGKAFALKHNLAAHEMIHVGIKGHQCGRCDKSFFSKYLLSMHARVHSGEKPFACDQCGKAYAQRNKLTVHLRCHSGERPFACARCDKRFARKDYLVFHQKTHETKPFACPACKKTFSRQINLDFHARLHNAKKTKKKKTKKKQSPSVEVP